jgi:Cd(II)/Pb(II)-responsive transcriptional regulator
MKIGDLAKRAGCTVETIRYYEREGLLSEPVRGANNYRLYGSSHLEALSFIRNCRALEMTLGEINVLLRIKELSGQDCGKVNTLLESHIAHVTERIKRLQQLETQLISLRQLCCQIQPVTKCAIMRELATPSVKDSEISNHADSHVQGTH